MEFKIAASGSPVAAATEFEVGIRRVGGVAVADAGRSRVDALHGLRSFIVESDPHELERSHDQGAYVPGSWTAGLERLTEREKQIALLVSRGKLNKQIASVLQISAHTVSTHLRNMFFKLGVHTRAELVFRCAESLRG